MLFPTTFILVVIWFAPYNPAGSTITEFAGTHKQCTEIGDAVAAVIKKAHRKHGRERGKLRITRQCVEAPAVIGDASKP
jgi:hypothetical protein